MGQALFLTGRPGVGKTTAIRLVVAQLGARAGGFYTEEIREAGRRTGFRLVTLGGETGTLAGLNVPGPYRVGRYGVHLSNLEDLGVQALRRAIRQPHVPVVVIDEIGKMELLSTAFREAVLDGLDSPKALIGAITMARSPWVNAVRARPDVTVMEITPANRSAIPELILAWLQRNAQDRAKG
jgi:nucleoside-triphosphatase